MQQISFSELAYTHKKMITRKERHRLTEALFRRTEQYLSERGLLSGGHHRGCHDHPGALFDQEPGPATGPGEELYEERDELVFRSESARGKRSPGTGA